MTRDTRTRSASTRTAALLAAACAVACITALAACMRRPAATAAPNADTNASIAHPTPPRLASSVTAPPIEDARQRTRHGLTLRFEPVGREAPPAPDARTVRLLALHVPAGQSPSPFLDPGPFRATWTGTINVPLRGEYAISASGRGSFKLTINDGQVLTCEGDDFASTPAVTVELNKGGNDLVAVYESPAAGDAFVRLYWAASDFAREPVPPDAFKHNIGDTALRAGERARLGRQLVATMRCLRCHDSGGAGDGFTNNPAHMPELAIDAPSLENAGNRLNPAWIAAWLLDPQALRPSATMPRMLAHLGGEAPARAADIAAYLATLKADEPAQGNASVTPNDEQSIQAGGDLFARLGCIGCHSLPDASQDDDQGRVPLRYVKAKWKPDALAEFLISPRKHYQWIGMPDFRFSREEAAAVASFLLAQQGASINAFADPTNADPARGKALVQRTGCLNCHAIDVPNEHAAPTLTAILRTGWSTGCLAGDGDNTGISPRFPLDDDQRDALRAFAATDWSSLARRSPVEFAARQLVTLRCDACHERDGLISWWEDLSGEVEHLKLDDSPANPENDKPDDPFAPDGFGEAEGAPPVDQTRPRLTWIGEKLKPQWAGRFIAGEVDYKPRTWMDARMPGFGPRGQLIAQGLAMEHGFPPAASPEPKPDPRMTEIGRRLVGKVGGFACNNCHAINNAPPTAVFEGQGVNFMYVRERITREYYHRWLRNPTRLVPSTTMPQYANEQGKTPLTEVYQGDAHRQYEAIRHYLLQGRDIQPPNH